jgi:hypothetical protein
MPAPPAPGIAALEAIWNIEGQICENTFHYTVAGGIDVAALNSIIACYENWVSTHPTLWHNASQLVKMQARDLTSSSGASVEANVTPPVSGTGGAGAQPNNVTFSLKRQTGLRGRKMRGRVFLLGIPTTSLDVGAQTLLVAVAAAYATAYNALLSSMLSAANATEVILHRSLGTGTQVTNYVYADLYMDSQRRRLPGHNRHR